MKKQMYTVKDKVADKCGGIDLYENRKEAIRAVEFAFNKMTKEGVSPGKREDFELIYLGEYDIREGIVYPSKEDLGYDLLPVEREIEEMETKK